MAALEGIRVLDLTQIMAGPFCTRLLADYGAEVIKIERPEGGDDARRMGFVSPTGESLSFIAMNRNKLGIAVDIRRPEGQDILWRLIHTADVLVENFRPGTMERLGFGYEAVHRVNPRLIYCSISGFGQTGPYRDRGGFDLVAQAMGGIISVTGTPEHPAKAGVPLSDLNAGLFASHAILVALVARGRTGEGQWIDTSLLEGAIAYTIWESLEYWATGVPPVGLGTAHRNSAPYQTFFTRDGSIAIGAANQRNWERLARALGRDDLLADPRFADNLRRLEHRAELEAELAPTLATKTTDEWLAILDEAGVPAGPVLRLDQVYQHPQVKARAMEIVIDHPVAGPTHEIGMPVKLSGTPAAVYRPAPLLGQHTFQVLRGLGYAEDQLRAWEQGGIIRDAHWTA
ncbi:MAG: CoA transferase [Actinomycetia bacterium]|jgi:crotonobetainyl-CoA:carnitine CoA-transferase CaiB-like acyl-CoA transferase|nr:CoA transferase [Actinomycetes bacterium]